MRGKDIYIVLKDRKKLLLGGSIVIFSWIFFLSGGETEISAGEIVQPPVTAKQDSGKESKSHRILGMEKVRMGEKLADPFSIAHLTREETEQARQEAERKQQQDIRERELEVPRILPETSAEEPDIPHRTVKDNGLSLQGIVTGKYGRMAILKRGKENLSAAVGDEVDGRILKEIGEKEVLFDDGQRIMMQMP